MLQLLEFFSLQQAIFIFFFTLLLFIYSSLAKATQVGRQHLRCKGDYRYAKESSFRRTADIQLSTYGLLPCLAYARLGKKIAQLEERQLAQRTQYHLAKLDERLVVAYATIVTQLASERRLVVAVVATQAGSQRHCQRSKSLAFGYSGGDYAKLI